MAYKRSPRGLGRLVPVVKGAIVAAKAAKGAWQVGRRVKRALWTSTPTKHKRASSKLFNKGKPDGMGGTFSYIRLKNKKKRIIKNISQILPKNVFLLTTAGRIAGAAGVQAIGTPHSLCGGVDLTNIMGTSGAVGSDTTTMNLTGVSASVTFTNQDKGNCEITIYDIITRKDQQAGATNRTPEYTFNQGLIEADTTGSSATVASTNLGITPFQSQMFCQFYKIKKVTKIIMGQGTCHVHRIKYALARKFENSFIAPSSRIGGLTYYCMVVVRGMPYNDTVTKTAVAAGSTAVDFVTDIRYNYNFILSNKQHIQYYNGQGTIITESVMDVGSGEAEVDAQA